MRHLSQFNLKKKSFSILLLCTGILWSQISQDAFAVPSYRDFSEIGLFSINQEDYEQQIEEMRKGMAEKVPSEKLFAQFDETYKLILKKAQNLEWMEIQTNLDRSRIYEGQATQNSEYVQWNDALCVLAKEICEDPYYQKDAKKIWGEELFQAYSDYIPMTEEQKKIVDKIKQIQSEVDLIRAEHTIEFDNQEYTLSELEEAQINGDITVEQYYSGYYDYAKSCYSEIGVQFLAMVKARNQLAKTAGYENYMAYAYKDAYARDYTYQDAEKLRGYVIDELLPEYMKYEKKLSEMATDLEPDTFTVEDGIAFVKKYMPLIDQGFSESIDFMLAHGLCDLDDAGGKVDFSFVADLSYDQESFLSIHGISNLDDLGVFAHELGHYNANYHSSELYWDNMINLIDIAETHSQGAELLSSLFYSDFTKNAAYAQANAIYGIESQMVYATVMDAIERDIYTKENLSLDDINRSFAKWMSLYYGFDFSTNSVFAYTWVMQDVLFSSPCYYISYVTSGFTALDLFCEASDSYYAGVTDYQKVISCDWEYSYRRMIEELDFRDPFVEEEFCDLSKEIQNRWQQCFEGKAVSAPKQSVQYHLRFSK